MPCSGYHTKPTFHRVWRILKSDMGHFLKTHMWYSHRIKYYLAIKGNTDTCKNLNESQVHYAKQKEGDLKGHGDRWVCVRACMVC